MPVRVKDAYTVLVAVAEEDYRFDLSGDLSGAQMAQMMKDIYDPDKTAADKHVADFVWMEKWLMSEDEKGCATPQVHEILNRSWRIIG